MIFRDVWAFGITLFEVYAYGDMPFGNLSNNEVCAAVVSGLRPEVPVNCHPEVGAIMMDCWRDVPHERVSIEDALCRMKAIQ